VNKPSTADRFVKEEGRLRYFSKSKAVVVVQTPLGCHKLCHIAFGKDGSIYVDFPYFGHGPGIVSRIEFPEPRVGPVTVDLKPGGKLASNQVKFSHHPTGRVLFSKTGRVRSEIRRDSFRLDGPIGYLFQLHAYWLSGFALLEAKKTTRLYLPFMIEEKIPSGVVLIAQWRRKADILESIEGAGFAGPCPMAIHRRTGAKMQLILLGQPSNHALQGHVMLLDCQLTEPLPGVENPMMLFLGGWDPHEVQDPGTGISMPHTGFLTFMYPCGSPEELKSVIGSIDLST
jgi:hypothetical protein